MFRATPKIPPLKFEINNWSLLVAASLGLLLAHAWLLAQAAVSGIWLVGLDGIPVPADFTAFWAAGHLALEGLAADAYDGAKLLAALTHNFGDTLADTKFPFFYPPLFFLAVAPLGLFPYAIAAALWIVATLGIYLAAIWAILPRREGVLLALAAPAVLWCICVGQNGLLSAGLLGGALALLDRRPLLAGMLFGMLAFKPQFGVLIPLILIVTGRWRVFASATITLLALLVLSGAAFGWNVFVAFVGGMTSANDNLLASGALPWFKMQSVYGLVRMLGLDASIAWLVHGLIAAPVTAAVLALWRSKASYEIKAASLSAAVLIVSPYSCIYDFPLVTVPVIFLMRDGLRMPLELSEKLGLGAAFLLPLAFPLIAWPVGPLVYAALAGVIFRRWILQGKEVVGPPGLEPGTTRLKVECSTS